MSELTQRWRDYLRLQEQLAEMRHVNDRSWGIEAGLDRLLDAAPPEELKRVVDSAGRKERHRARMRHVHVLERALEVEANLDARHRLARLMVHANVAERAILSAMGEGLGPTEIAALQGVSAGSMRVRIHRLRQQLYEKAA